MSTAMGRLFCGGCGNFTCACKRDAELAAQRDPKLAALKKREEEGTELIRDFFLVIGILAFLGWLMFRSPNTSTFSTPSYDPCEAIRQGQRVSAEQLADCIKERGRE